MMIVQAEAYPPGISLNQAMNDAYELTLKLNANLAFPFGSDSVMVTPSGRAYVMNDGRSQLWLRSVDEDGAFRFYLQSEKELHQQTKGRKK